MLITVFNFINVSKHLLLCKSYKTYNNLDSYLF